MSRNIIVTTPLKSSRVAEQEAAARIEQGGGYYFRSFGKNHPQHISSGSKVYYVDKGHITGYAVIDSINAQEMKCEITGRKSRGITILMKADSWKWVKPIPHAGFQGFRYFDQEPEVVGDWLDPKPV